MSARWPSIMPPAAAMPAFGRLPDWLKVSTDREVRQALLTEALGRVRRENTEIFLTLLEEWLRSPLSGVQVWGLRALIPVLEADFENLPAVFRILRPAVEAAGPATQLELQDCLLALGRVSPTETIHFLAEAVENSANPMLARTLRRILPNLAPDMQAGLREVLRSL